MRYKDCGSDVKKLLSDVQVKYFRDTRDAKIKCIFDTKMRKNKGKIVLASVRKTNDLLRHLSAEEAQDEAGYDYIITIDGKAWEIIPDIDKERLLRHEMRHVLIDEEAKDPYKTAPHDLEDFVEEVRLNIDDPGWAGRVCTLVAEVYAQEKEQAKEAKASKNSRGKSLKRVRK
jgi:hypothetical protein